MNLQKYQSSVEDYLNLTSWHELRLEYISGQITTKAGTPVVLFGGATSEGTLPGAAMVLINNATQEEVEQLAAFVAGMRKVPPATE